MNLVNISLVFGTYLLGSIPFGFVYCRQKYKLDIRNYGSGNIGATNVGRVITQKFGKKKGKTAKKIILFSDVLKGAIPVAAALVLRQTETVIALVAFAALLGHCFPIYLGFKESGKGVATGLGTIIPLLTFWSLVPLLVYFVMKKITGYVSAASITATALPVTIGIVIHKPSEYIALFFGCLGVIVFTHRSNIVRMLNRTENRVGG